MTRVVKPRPVATAVFGLLFVAAAAAAVERLVWVNHSGWFPTPSLAGAIQNRFIHDAGEKCATLKPTDHVEYKWLDSGTLLYRRVAGGGAIGVWPLIEKFQSTSIPALIVRRT